MIISRLAMTELRRQVAEIEVKLASLKASFAALARSSGDDALAGRLKA